MRYLRQHIDSIITTYKGEVPLSHFLKNYFRQYPILGSRDRRMLSAVAYSWYRCAKGVTDQALLSTSLESWAIENKLLTIPLTELISSLAPAVQFSIDALFPFPVQLSAGISWEAWLSSMLIQPQLFIRVRKDKDKITALLATHSIPYNAITDNCLALPNGAKIDTLLPPDSYVVQDASSQQTGSYFLPAKNEHWYDCCSGAGGKSLLLRDLMPSVHLTVTDRRASILHNLTQRFRQYNLKPPVTHVADVADKQALASVLGPAHFHAIICDAPCSGSGTWARTPEQLYFFDPETIKEYAALQKKIAVNAAAYLRAGGRLIYITCSVFREENEEVVEEIITKTGLQLVDQHLINGIGIRADSMFIAVLRKA